MNIVFEYGELIPVKKYGGSERVLYWLIKELVVQGHKVFLIGNPQSSVSSIGCTLIPKSSSVGDNWKHLIPDNVDIVHFFNTPPFDVSDLNIVVTIHGNGQVGESFHKNTLFLSKRHAQLHGSEHYVYNGLDLEEYPSNLVSEKSTSWNKFMFLANARWKVKNLKDCINACKQKRKHLYIAGGRSFSFSSYVHSLGMVDLKTKINLIQDIDALLFPVRWEEPFGLAVIEAMALGKPVIASSYGSLKELVSKNVGVIVDNYENFEEVLSISNMNFDAYEIRHYVEKNFTSKIMAENYLKYYKFILAGNIINNMAPQRVLTTSPLDLLPF